MISRSLTDRRKIVLFGLFGMNNLGNDATLSITLHHLRDRMPNAHVLCVCGNPSVIKARHDIDTLPFDPLPVRGVARIPGRVIRERCERLATSMTESLRIQRAAQLIRGAEKFLVLGTGALDDFGAEPWNVPTWLLRWCHAAHQAQAQIEFVAVGAGPITNGESLVLMTRAVRFSSRRSYRDQVSRDFLDRIGVDTARDSVVPDLAFGLPLDLANSISPSTPPRTVGVGVMGYYGWHGNAATGDDIYKTYIGKMVAFVDWLLAEGYRVRLLTGEVGTDDRAVNDIMRTAAARPGGEIDDKLVAESIESLEGLLRELAKSDVVVASRYHNILFALALFRPAIAIGYADKFDALMSELGLAGFSQNIETLDVERLTQQFQRIVDESEDVAKKVKARVGALRSEVGRLYDSLFICDP